MLPKQSMCKPRESEAPPVNTKAFELLLPQVYGELRRLASRHPRRQRRGLKEPFSDFVRLLSGSREVLDPEPFDRVWTALRATLQREMRRRNLWHLPPAYLGVSGRASWFGAGSAGRGLGRCGDALEELVTDCYTYVFLTRLDSLQAQLRLKPNIEGLVLLSIRSFLLERQRHFDPIGSRVYEVLRSAIRKAVTEEVCFVQAGDRRIRGGTVIAFDQGILESGQAADSLLAEAASEWADDLLPDLVTSVGRAQAAVERRISDHLRSFPRRGVHCLRFGALLNPLKIEVRARWGAIFDRSLGEAVGDLEEGFVHLVRSVQPDTSFEDRQSFDSLTARIALELEQFDADERTVRYLQRLWGFLRSYALDNDEPHPRPPSQRQIATDLRIPRDRLPRLCAALGELILRHHAAGTAPSALRGECL